MPASLEGKLVVAVSTTALFDLREADDVFRRDGEQAYHIYQLQRETEPLSPGPAFPFIRRLLAVNSKERRFEPVEVVILSRNSADTGLRAMNSVEHHKLPITRAAFTRGRPPFPYMRPFGAKLFLSTNVEDVAVAIEKGHAAGLIMTTPVQDDEDDPELRIAFDFDGILADDSAEAVFQKGSVDTYHEHERMHAATPLPPGPLHPLLSEIAKIQREEAKLAQADATFRPRIRTAVFTARNAPAHRRAIQAMRHWGLQVDEALFLGGLEKTQFLKEFRPHIFFDDQRPHVARAASSVPSVLIPFRKHTKGLLETLGADTSPVGPAAPDPARRLPVEHDGA